MRTMLKRLAGMFRKARLERELDEEVRLHLDLLEQRFRDAGMEPGAARAAARREFGGLEQMKEVYRDRRGLPWLEVLFKDLAYAARGLRRNPGFTAAAVLSLAVGIGANTAVFSLINAFLLRMLPVRDPGRLVSLYRTGGWGQGFISWPLYLELRDRKDVFSGVLARSGVGAVRFSVGSDERPDWIAREFVSGNYFEVLGVTPALGRLFTEDDNRTPQGHPLAVLSYDFWRGRLGGDPGVLGRVLRIDEQPLTVIGVAAPGFRGVEVDRRAGVWVPAMMSRGKIMDARMHWIWALGRRRPEVTPRQVQAATDAVLQHHLQAVYGNQPDSAWRRSALRQRIEVRDGGVGISLLRDQFGKPLLVLMGAVALVLLIACANVANLLLARGAARRREFALRFALGAGRSRLVRQSLGESVLLGAGASVLGYLLAHWGVALILLFLPNSVTDFEAHADLAVLGFTAAVSLASVLLFGLLPAFRTAAVDPAPALKEGGLRLPSARLGLRKGLVIAQVALSVALVALAGLFGRSLAGLRSLDPGFHNAQVMSFRLDFPRAWDRSQREQFRGRLERSIERLAGVHSFSYGFPGPYLGGFGNAGMRVPGSERTAKEPAWVRMQTVGPRYFETIGTALRRGREFARADAAGTRKVAVINEAFARFYFPGVADPTTRFISFDDSKPEGGEPTFIVGVVPDIRHDGLRQPAEPTVYVPLAQSDTLIFGDPVLLVSARVPGLVPLLRHQVAALNSEVALVEPRTLRQQIDDSIFLERMVAALSGLFGAIALLLAAIGLYGVLAYAVTRRTAEIGLRMALGAPAASVLWMVLREGALLVAAGIGIGLPLSLATGRVVSSLLFGIQPTDSLTFAATACVLLAVGGAAALLPARRGARIDPVTALRQE